VRRLARHVFTLAAALSLLLGVAVGVAWVRSYWWVERVTWQRIDGRPWIESAPGRLRIALWVANHANLPESGRGFRYTRDEARYAGGDEWFLQPLFGDRYATRKFGPLLWHTRQPPLSHVIHARVIVPFWWIVVGMSILPLTWTIRRLRFRRRKQRGLCPTCGYDLRATPDRCPECGTPAAAATIPERAAPT
jgi:hypothetical protein